MIMLETRSGGFVPLHNIARIGGRPSWIPKDQRRKDTVTVDLMSGGERVEADEYAVDELLRTAVQSWPAQPDTYILDYSDEAAAEGRDPWRTAVIAWGLTLEAYVVPITVDGVNDGRTNASLKVLQPDGTVTDPGNCTWRTEAEFIAEMQAFYRSQAEQAAKRANDAAPDDSAPTS